jgi:hypothetical protein
MISLHWDRKGFQDVRIILFVYAHLNTSQQHGYIHFYKYRSVNFCYDKIKKYRLIGYYFYCVNVK